MSAEQEWRHWVALHVADALVIVLVLGLIMWLTGAL